MVFQKGDLQGEKQRKQKKFCVKQLKKKNWKESLQKEKLSKNRDICSNLMFWGESVEFSKISFYSVEYSDEPRLLTYNIKEL